MLYITVPAREFYDSSTQSFIQIPEKTLSLEHSLVSLQKWESKWKKPFLSEVDKTEEETRDYIRCMTVTQNVDPLTYIDIPEDVLQKVKDYIQDPMTATWFNEKNKPSKEVTTAELIYYWMIAAGIPAEYRKWHLAQLMTLIRVCSIKNDKASGKHKMGRRDIANRNRSLNAARRKRMNTNG